MTGEASGWVRRFDITQLIQNKIDFSAWKGDDHTKGVFFDSTYAIVLNKILAVRIRHDSTDKEVDMQEDLFFSFDAIAEEDGTAFVSERYPFREMTVKPKKHFLLFDQEELGKPDIPKLFDQPFDYGKLRVRPQLIANALDRVTNKRDRERSIASLQVTDDQLLVNVFKSQSRRKKIDLVREQVACEVWAEPRDHSGISASVNAHTLFYLLGIFYTFSYVTFHFGRDRIMITGDSSDHTPNVEVVVSRLKTA